MAHHIIGLDLGSSSVKAVALRLGFRGSEVVSVDSEPVPLGEEGQSRVEDVFAAAGQLIRRLATPEDTVHCAMPGEGASLSQLFLPTSASRRLEQVLRFELDEVLPFDLDEAVFDFAELGRSGEEIAILAATAKTDRVRQLIDGLRKHGVDPREVSVAPLCYNALLEGDAVLAEGVSVLVDVGHVRTNVAILGDKVPTSRAILRGGRDVTKLLAQVGKISFGEAEAFKRRDGLSGKVGEYGKRALTPLVGEIRRTINGHLAAGGRPVDRVLLCGAGGLLKGLDNYLAEQLSLPVEPYRPALGPKKPSEDEAQGATLAYALALRETLPKSRRFNLRRGELSFKGDFEFLKRRMVWVAACILAVLASWIFANYAEYKVLESQSAEDQDKLAAVTKELFGKPLFSREEIEELLGTGEREKPPMPEKDAFDVVLELSRRIPKEVVHDVELLEIKSKRTTLKGIVDPEVRSTQVDPLDSDGELQSTLADAGAELSPTDLIKMKLEEFTECFTAIRVGKVTSVGERRKYQMDIDSKCP